MFAYLTFACEIDLTKPKETTPNEAIPKDLPRECRVYDIRIAGNAGPRAKRKLWLTIGATAYTSTFKDSPSARYAWFENNMIEFEPMLYKRSGWLRQGIGFKHDRFYGKNFKSFERFALQAVLFTIPLQPARVEILPTVAFYQGRFDAGQFGGQPESPKKSKWEKVVIGFKLEYLPKPPPKTATVQATPKPGQ
jgi:hypothetical protein